MTCSKPLKVKLNGWNEAYKWHEVARKVVPIAIGEYSVGTKVEVQKLDSEEWHEGTLTAENEQSGFSSVGSS